MLGKLLYFNRNLSFDLNISSLKHFLEHLYSSNTCVTSCRRFYEHHGHVRFCEDCTSETCVVNVSLAQMVLVVLDSVNQVIFLVVGIITFSCLYVSLFYYYTSSCITLVWMVYCQLIFLVPIKLPSLSSDFVAQPRLVRSRPLVSTLTMLMIMILIFISFIVPDGLSVSLVSLNVIRSS